MVHFGINYMVERQKRSRARLLTLCMCYHQSNVSVVFDVVHSEERGQERIPKSLRQQNMIEICGRSPMTDHDFFFF